MNLDYSRVHSCSALYVVDKLQGVSPKMRVVVSKSVQLTSRYLICLYQFPVHGDQEQKIDYYLTAGAHNSPAA